MLNMRKYIGFRRLSGMMWILLYAECILITDASSPCLPGVCVCGAKKVSCTNKHLDYIPVVPNDTTYLDFSGNRLFSLTRQTFSNISELKITTLKLTSCKISYITKDAFETLQFIQTLDLGENDFSPQNLENGLFGLSSSPILYLNLSSQNNFTDSLPTDLFNGLSNTTIRNISLTDGYLTHLQCSIFRKLKSLVYLNVSDNYIRNVSIECMSNLQVLDLSENDIVFLPRFCSKENKSYVPNIQTLNLENNHINMLHILKEDGHCLPKLQDLSLSFNPISEISTEQFMNLRSLTSLYLNHLMVTKMRLEDKAFSSETLKHLAIGVFQHVITKEITIFQNCPSMRKLEISNIRLYTLSSEQLDMLFRPVMNLTLLAIRYAYLMEIPRFVSEMVHLEMLSLRSNIIGQWHSDTFQKLTKLHYINLADNRITVINRTSFSPEFLTHVQTLILKYNPYSCTCDNYWFIQWAKENSKKLVAYPQHFECYSPPSLSARPLRMYNPSNLECNGLLPYQVIVLVCGITLVVMVTLGLLYMRYRWHIRYYMYLLRSKRETDTFSECTEYVYDAFVAYTSEDRHWVISNLMATLEGKHGYKLCLHERDFLPGQTILDQISETIKHSRKVILVLSDNFAKSQWCQYEILLANHRLVEDGGNVLILILLEDIRSKYMTNCLGMLMRTMTYIKWPHSTEERKFFWNKVNLSMK